MCRSTPIPSITTGTCGAGTPPVVLAKTLKLKGLEETQDLHANILIIIPGMATVNSGHG
jgi:hypothetical protein